MEAFVEKEKRSYFVYIKHHNQKFYMQYRSKEKERAEWYCDMFNKMLYDNMTENNSYMQIKNYSSKEEIEKKYDSCYTKKSTLWDIYNTISFREYDSRGNTNVFHVYHKKS